MQTTIVYEENTYTIDLSKPIDISIPINVGQQNINAWYLDDPKIYPVTNGDWVGNVAKGAAVNFNMIEFNPHSHITHTECAGHITKEVYSVNKNLQQFFFLAELISVNPKKLANGDCVITKEQLVMQLQHKKVKAVVIRTLPNTEEKKHQRYSHTNPPYLLEETAIYLRELGIEHLLIDLPSVDREQDEGKLLAHHAFWNTKEQLRLNATITEFIYVPAEVKDGIYFLNLMIAPFENDATPSKPILYEITK